MAASAGADSSVVGAASARTDKPFSLAAEVNKLLRKAGYRTKTVHRDIPK